MLIFTFLLPVDATVDISCGKFPALPIGSSAGLSTGPASHFRAVTVHILSMTVCLCWIPDYTHDHGAPNHAMIMGDDWLGIRLHHA